MIEDQTILITGGTGSLGNAIIPKLAIAKKIIVYSRGEYAQVEMERKFSKDEFPSIRYFLGDIRDRDRLYRALDGVNIVIHCAAIKHVDKAQYDPFEAVKTNTNGAQNIIDAAIDCGVKKVIAISSDKAANPVSLYGASKLCADFMFIAASAYSPHKNQTKFSVIRFGNFWGSSGSIVEILFKNQNTKIFPITDKRMTRFFITLDCAADYVIDALNIMQGGEIFTPKMVSRKIVDVIKEICPKAKLKVIGIRPGEKLHEDLIVKAYAQQTYETERWYITYPKNCNIECIGILVKENFEYNSFIALGDK